MLYSEQDDQKNVWYAMRALYRTEIQTKALLEEAGIKCFVPLKETIVTTRGGQEKEKSTCRIQPYIRLFHPEGSRAIHIQ